MAWYGYIHVYIWGTFRNKKEEKSLQKYFFTVCLLAQRRRCLRYRFNFWVRIVVSTYIQPQKFIEQVHLNLFLKEDIRLTERGKSSACPMLYLCGVLTNGHANYDDFLVARSWRVTAQLATDERSGECVIL